MSKLMLSSCLFLASAAGLFLAEQPQSLFAATTLNQSSDDYLCCYGNEQDARDAGQGFVDEKIAVDFRVERLNDSQWKLYLIH